MGSGFKLLLVSTIGAAFLCMIQLAGCGGTNGSGNSTPTVAPATTPGSTAPPTGNQSGGSTNGTQPQAHFLYSLTLNTADVYAFQTSTSKSQLTTVPGSPFPSNGTRVDTFAADPQLGFLFVANIGSTYALGDNITTFSVDTNSGSLTPASTFNTTGLELISLAVSPSGNYLYATSGTFLACCSPWGRGGIYIFSISPTGALKQVAYVDDPPGMGSAPTALAIDPTGAFLYSAAAWQSDSYHTGITVMAYAITNGGSGLSLLAKYPEIDPTPSNTSASAICVSSNYLYASTSGGGALYVFQRHADGTIAQLPSPAFSGLSLNAQGIAATPDGKFVYVADGINARVLAFAVGNGGSLTQVESFGVGSSGSNWISQVIVDLSGKTLYVAAGNGGEIFVLAIGSDGRLTQATGSPYLTDTQAASNRIVLF